MITYHMYIYIYIIHILLYRQPTIIYLDTLNHSLSCKTKKLSWDIYPI